MFASGEGLVGQDRHPPACQVVHLDLGPFGPLQRERNGSPSVGREQSTSGRAVHDFLKIIIFLKDYWYRTTVNPFRFFDEIRAQINENTYSLRPVYHGKTFRRNFILFIFLSYFARALNPAARRRGVDYPQFHRHKRASIGLPPLSWTPKGHRWRQTKKDSLQRGSLFHFGSP